MGHIAFPSEGSVEHNYNSWTIDGLANERIIATGVYFYSVENTTHSKSRIGSRERLNGLNNSGEYRGVSNIEYGYGIIYDETYQQKIGHVNIKQGRCFVYSNTC